LDLVIEIYSFALGAIGLEGSTLRECPQPEVPPHLLPSQVAPIETEDTAVYKLKPLLCEVSSIQNPKWYDFR
jgi:hypothetical protein